MVRGAANGGRESAIFCAKDIDGTRRMDERRQWRATNFHRDPLRTERCRLRKGVQVVELKCRYLLPGLGSISCLTGESRADGEGEGSAHLVCRTPYRAVVLRRLAAYNTNPKVAVAVLLLRRVVGPIAGDGRIFELNLNVLLWRDLASRGELRPPAANIVIEERPPARALMAWHHHIKPTLRHRLQQAQATYRGLIGFRRRRIEETRGGAALPTVAHAEHHRTVDDGVFVPTACEQGL